MNKQTNTTIPPGEIPDTIMYSPITQFKMSNPIPPGEFRVAFQYKTRIVYATAPIASRFKMNAVRIDFDMGIFDYNSLMFNLERVPGVTCTTIDLP